MQFDEAKKFKTDLDFTKKVVLNLVSPLQNLGYKLYIGSWYCSPELLFDLKNIGIFGTGIAKKNRKYLPKSENEEEVKSATTGKMNYVNFKDKKYINVISTFFDIIPTAVKNKAHSKEKIIPSMVSEYNNNSHGVDLSNQMGSYYSVSCKCNKW